MRKYGVWLIGVLLLLAINISIWHKEQVLTHGKTVLLALVPVDPRSLMQGDYMSLRFQLENDMLAHLPVDKSQSVDGCVLVTLTNQGVGEFKQMMDTWPKTLAANQLALRYRLRQGQVKFATNAFFFEEGRAGDYARARYGEFRVADDGELLLTAMRGEKLELLGKSSL